MNENDNHTPAMTDRHSTQSTDTDLTATNSSTNGDVSRRTVFKTTAVATGLLAGVGISNPIAAQEITFQLGGKVAGWQGRSPSSIEGQTNPTLELEAGIEYEIIWRNLDGAPHNIVIEDADGNNLVRTKLISEQGASQSVTFTASEKMAEYYCEAHPQSMRGTVNISGTTANGTEAPTATQTQTATATPTATATETPDETATTTPHKTADGPLMADEACPENKTENSGHRNDTCAKGENRTNGEGSGEDDFEQLIQLMIRLIRRLLGGR